ncbi:hypothetical protein [Clostridium culturomicium]|uniref:hypothetical protein n=1 Tax=Clostridium culturomicium TaxID=1499683 RepID=UPI00058F72AA|nr:hypothetical protein [Clostridium culturomicium]
MRREMRKKLMSKEEMIREIFGEEKRDVKEVAKEIVEVLEEKLETKVEYSYCKSDKSVYLNVFLNKYDYAKVSFSCKYNLGLDTYVSVVLDKLKQKDCVVHKASRLEKIMVDMIKEYESEFYIMDGVICLNNNEIAALEDVKDYSISECEECVIVTLRGNDEMIICDLLENECDVYEEDSKKVIAFIR